VADSDGQGKANFYFIKKQNCDLIGYSFLYVSKES
jgi:hypothetical protein